jgi:hypothetical protein
VAAKVLACIALALGGALGAMTIFPHPPIGIKHVTAVLVVPLATLLVTGFVLTGLHIRLDHRSVAVFVAVVVAGLGISALIRRNVTDVDFDEQPLPTESERLTAEQPTEALADADESAPVQVRPSGRRTSALVIAFAVLAVAATVVSLVSSAVYDSKESFIALSATYAPASSAKAQQVDVEVANHNESNYRYRLVVTNGRATRKFDLVVPQGTTRHLSMPTRRAVAVDVQLYRSDQPTTVFREVLLRGGRAHPIG